MHDDNCFITLTYDDQHLPPDYSLRVSDWQKFMKRLRERTGKRIRFFHCGEYGDLTSRPHYHAILFGLDFSDKVLWKENKGFPLWTSRTLEKVWGMGHCPIGALTFESAAYVGRYCVKKIKRKDGDDNLWLGPDGHYYPRKSEYSTSSQGPGIGGLWLENYAADVFPRDYTVASGKRQSVPRYYTKWLEKEDKRKYRQVKAKRIAKAVPRTDRELLASMKVRQAYFDLLPRELE